MKKFISLILTISILALTGCGNTQKFDDVTIQTNAQTESSSEAETLSNKIDINIAALKGPTAMGMVKLMNDTEQELTSNNYNFSISATADEIVAKIGKGEIDIAAVPANLASVLYNNTKGKISVAAINTLGVLYVVQKMNTEDAQEIKTIQDLKGSTILSTGKGTTPEYVLNYILSSNGIDPLKDVNIEFKSEATEVVASMSLSSAQSSIAVLPEPFVTTAQAKDESLKTVLDLTEQWDSLQDNKSLLVTGVVIVRNEFIENNKDSFNKFLDEYKQSTDYINTNVKDGATLVEKFDIVPKAIAEKAIPKCNITFIEGEDMQQKLSGYLEVLFNQNPKSIGGNLPDETFYYKR